MTPAEAPVPSSPFLPMKRQRTTPSRLVPTAAERMPSAWTLQQQPGGRRRATCLACQHQIDEHAPRTARTSEIVSGGRWYHPCCIPGGLRSDDTLAISGPGSPDMCHMVDIQTARHQAAHAAPSTAVDSAATPLASAAHAGTPSTQLESPASGATVHGPLMGPEGVPLTPETSPAQPLRLSQADPDIWAMIAEPDATPIVRAASSAGDTEAPDPNALPLDEVSPEEDVLSDHLWLQALCCRAPLLTTLTPNFNNIYSDIKVGLIKDALLTPEDSVEYSERWWRLLLVDKLLFHKGGDSGTSLNAKLRARFQAARDGDWLDLVTDLIDAAPVGLAPAKRPSEADTARRVQAMAAQGSWTRAITAARADAPPDRSPQAWPKLLAELPKVDSRCLDSEPITLNDTQTEELRTALLAKIRKADPAASPGLLGSPPHLWKLLVKEDEAETTELVLDLLARIACGQVGPAVRRLLIHADLIAGSRTDDRVRPIEVPSFLRKTAMSALMDILSTEIQHAAGPQQVGLRTPDGTSVAYAVLEHELRKNPTHVIASVDISGAHSMVRRDALERICHEDAPTLGQVLRRWYHTSTPKTWRGPTTNHTETNSGLGQGSPEAAPLFCAGLGRVLRLLRRSHPTITTVAFQDDIYLVGPLPDILSALTALDALLAELGLQQNPNKLQLYTNDPTTAAHAPGHLRSKFVPTLNILGQRLAIRMAEGGLDYSFGHTAIHRHTTLNKAYAQMDHLGTRLRSLTAAGLPLAVAHRLWVLATSGALTHLQSVDYYTHAEMDRFNTLQSAHMAWMTGRALTARDKALALLPLQHGGGGLPDHARAAVGTFLAAQSRLAHTVSSKLDIPSVEEYLAQRPDIRAKLQDATQAAITAGVPRNTIPTPHTSGGRKTVQKGKALTQALQKQAKTELQDHLSPPPPPPPDRPVPTRRQPLAYPRPPPRRSPGRPHLGHNAPTTPLPPSPRSPQRRHPAPHPLPSHHHHRTPLRSRRG